MRSGIIAVMAAAALAGGACSSPTEASAPKCDPVDYASFDAQNPAISFRSDVLPIQRRACAFTPCHGKIVGSKVDMFLGTNIHDTAPDDAMIGDIIATMKETSATAPAMARVQPGDPQHSFLMLKLDACQGEANLDCTVQAGALSSNPCGDTMPRSSEQLSRAERDIYRRWIAQGAQDN